MRPETQDPQGRVAVFGEIKSEHVRMTEIVSAYRAPPFPLVFQTSHGAMPPMLNPSNCCLSLNVSMLAQNPSYGYPINCFSATSLLKGSITSSSLSRMYSNIFFLKMKKPPL